MCPKERAREPASPTKFAPTLNRTASFNTTREGSTQERLHGKNPRQPEQSELEILVHPLSKTLVTEGCLRGVGPRLVTVRTFFYIAARVWADDRDPLADCSKVSGVQSCTAFCSCGRATFGGVASYAVHAQHIMNPPIETIRTQRTFSGRGPRSPDRHGG